MEVMGTLGFVFGILGFLAFCSQSSLKSRIKRLEDELSSMKGSSYSLSRESIAGYASQNKGKRVKISFKEDCADTDVIMYGNTKGSNVILDSDDSWILVEITSPKKTVRKLLRIDSIDGLTLINE